jgi:hypothetical protein
MRAGQPVKLRDLGYDEIWLQNWLADSPARLGLGEVRIVAQELTAPRGGSLDILAADGDIYYSVEVQLGEVDASHSFRVFDYWARNRVRFEGKTHVAVLVVESAAGRYRPALEALAEYLPLVVIELRAWRGEAEVILVPETVVINRGLDVAGPAGTVSGEARSAADWKASVSAEAWAFHDAFIAWTRANLGEVRVDYSPKSYVGVRRGRRVAFGKRASRPAGSRRTTQGQTRCPSGFERQTSLSPSCRNCSVPPSRSWLPGPRPGQNGTRSTQPTQRQQLQPGPYLLSAAIEYLDLNSHR